MEPTDQRIVDYIRDYCAEFGFSPTYGEIGEFVGLMSKDSVHRRLHQLRRAGHVTFLDGQQRTVRVVESIYNGSMS